jgi:hypothetical protein
MTTLASSNVKAARQRLISQIPGALKWHFTCPVSTDYRTFEVALYLPGFRVYQELAV